MQRTITTTVPFCHAVRAGGLELPQLEGIATIEGTREEWWIENLEFADVTFNSGCKLSWGHIELGDDELSHALYDAYVSVLNADPEWQDQADAAMREAWDGERHQAAYDRHQFHNAAE